MLQFRTLLRPSTGLAVGAATGLGVTALSQVYDVFAAQGEPKWIGRHSWPDNSPEARGAPDDDGKASYRQYPTKSFDGHSTFGGSPTSDEAVMESRKKYKASYEGKSGPTSGPDLGRVEAGNVLAYTSHFPARRRSALDYTPGNLQMMKEYNMTEEEWAFEFGGRPHQQRQSVVALSDYFRHRFPDRYHDACGHKALPFFRCVQLAGGRMGHDKGLCKHEAHEWELCSMAEAIRQNQVLQKKKKVHAMYTESERNWLYNDPNWGHLMFRSKFGAHTLKAGWGFGAGSRCVDPPTQELSVSQNTAYNPDIIRADPAPCWNEHKGVVMAMSLNTFKLFWNKHAWKYPRIDGDRSYEMEIPFCPLKDGAYMHGH